MLSAPFSHARFQQGFSLLEVLVTIIIIAIGLLGLAGLLSRMQLAELESYQRAQALLMLSDMTDRLSTNRSSVGSYVTASTIGTGDNQSATCTSLAVGASRDICEWSNILKGSGEQASGYSASGTNIGGIQGGRGCITQLQAASTGTCTPAIYQVVVAWQGMAHTVSPAFTCASGSYGSDDAFRRVVGAKISVGLPGC